jgi:hypothetical protein
MLFPDIPSAAKSHFAALEGTLLRLLEIDK